ncbi:MAG: hypothetical protein MPJ22_12610, partial [Pirellulales bacterium]|nr:hypothetical protein [Pirellulales bacterium]
MPPVANGVAYNLVEHGFANLQISENRNNITPPLGVAANPLELAWRTPGAGDTWTSIGNVGDSSRNGNTTRLRMTIATSAEFSARFDGIPAGAELGYRAAAPINTPALNAGTYVFGGTDGNGNPDWNLISSNSSSTTSDTFSLRVENSDASDTIDYTNNTVNKFRFGSGIIAAADPTGTDDNDVLISVPSSSSYHDSDVRLNEGSTTLTENALVRSEITEGVTSFTINRVADDLAWELGDYGHAFTENGTSSFNFRVTAYDASANTLTVIVERIVETTENPNFGWNINIGNLSYPGLRVTQELSASVEDVDNIIFDNRHFSVSDRGNGDVEIVATSALSGGVDIREDNTTVLASAGILNFGAGFNVATEGTGTA